MNLFVLLAIGVAGFAVVMALAFALALRTAVTWSREVVELERDGVRVTGRVVEKRRQRSRGATSAWIRYTYVDRLGRGHRSRRNLVTPDAWEGLTEGGPIAVVYSSRRPQVSAPEYLLALGPTPAGRGAADRAVTGDDGDGEATAPRTAFRSDE